MNVFDAVFVALSTAINSIILFIPQLLSGLIIFIIGLLFAGITKTIVQRGAKIVNIGMWLDKAHIEKEKTAKIWINLVSQVVYWFIILSFLIPTFNAWQIPAITGILNKFILYLPNVLAAVMIGFVGIIASNISYEAVLNASSSIGQRASNIMANAAQYSIIFFAVLMALNQLGISQNLIQILLTGFVAMMAIAGGLGIGLSIGLGGQETVKNTLKGFMGQRKVVGAKGGKSKKRHIND